MTYVYILSTLPSAIHLFAATGILNDWNYQNPQRDSIEWWIDSFVDCYRLGPYNGEFKNIIAYIQLVVGIATLLIHLLKLLKYRPIMYYLFLALYVCTQLRHLVFSSGVFVIGYLFTHMMIYMILVMYYETRIRKLIL